MRLFSIEKQDAHIKIVILGKIKIRFKNVFIDRLGDCCCVENIDFLKKQNTLFPHPIGIVISPQAKIGKDCTIFQNVTIGSWRDKSPQIGDNVIIYANSVLFGDISVGNNAVIGAGSVVTKSVPDNAIVCGNPAKIIGTNDKK